VLGFTADGKALWLESSAGRDTLAIVKRDLATGQEVVVAGDPRADAGSVLFNRTTHQVEAASFNRERIRWQAIGPQVAADLKALEKHHPGELSIVNRDQAMQNWVVAYATDIHPTDYYLYARGTKKLTHLFDTRPDLAEYKLAPVKPVTIKSRDGLDLVSYL